MRWIWKYFADVPALCILKFATGKLPPWHEMAGRQRNIPGGTGRCRDCSKRWNENWRWPKTRFTKWAPPPERAGNYDVSSIRPMVFRADFIATFLAAGRKCIGALQASFPNNAIVVECDIVRLAK